MKLATFIAVAFIFCVTLPNEIKAKGKKPKPAKFCIGENGKRYAKGKGYEDKEACKSYTCVKQGKKLKMKEAKIPCGGSVDGAWSEWSNFGACSATCGTAAKTRTRSCTNPPPSNGGKSCPGLKEQTIACNVSQCEGEPTPGGGDVTESIQFLNASMESMERKIDDLEASLESLMEKMAAMQSTSENYESCLADVCSATPGPHSEYNLVVTGGKKDAYEMPLATSEIISPGGVCSQVIPPLPVAIVNPESAYFNNSLYVCGGYTTTGPDRGTQNKCYQLRDANSQWTQGPDMNRNRGGITLTSVGEDLYAIGGSANEEDDYLDSVVRIEKLSVSSGKWTLIDQKLSPPRSGHCTVFMEKTKSLIIIGGATNGNVFENVGLVEEFSLVTSTFTQLSTMPVPGRLIGPSCAVLDEAVVVAGGWINADEHAGGGGGAGAQKEVYTLANGQWKITGELKTPRTDHVLGILDNKLLVIGGKKFSPNGYLDSIEEIQRNGSSQIMPWKLNEKRSACGIARVPRELFPCV